MNNLISYNWSNKSSTLGKGYLYLGDNYVDVLILNIEYPSHILVSHYDWYNIIPTCTMVTYTYDNFICLVLMSYGPNLGYISLGRYVGGFALINAPKCPIFGQLRAWSPLLMSFKSLGCSYSLKNGNGLTISSYACIWVFFGPFGPLNAS